jgi:hypothetical protein
MVAYFRLVLTAASFRRSLWDQTACRTGDIRAEMEDVPGPAVRDSLRSFWARFQPPLFSRFMLQSLRFPSINSKLGWTRCPAGGKRWQHQS